MTMNTVLSERLLNEPVTLLAPSPQFTEVLSFQRSRKKVLQKFIPALTDQSFDSLIVLGKPTLIEIAKHLNPDYKLFFTNQPLTPLEYSRHIQSLNLPVSTTGYTYFHDVYFHVLGLNFIPAEFTSWWKDTNHLYCETDLVYLASIVEWTTLKGQSEIIESLFHPSNWKQLILFFSQADPNQFNAQTLDSTYRKYPQVSNIIKQWHQISID